MKRISATLGDIELRLRAALRNAEAAATVNNLRRATGVATRGSDGELGANTPLVTDSDRSIDDIHEVDDAAEDLLRARKLALTDTATAGLNFLRTDQSRMVTQLQQIAGLA